MEGKCYKCENEAVEDYLCDECQKIYPCIYTETGKKYFINFADGAEVTYTKTGEQSNYSWDSSGSVLPPGELHFENDIDIESDSEIIEKYCVPGMFLILNYPLYEHYVAVGRTELSGKDEDFTHAFEDPFTRYLYTRKSRFGGLWSESGLPGILRSQEKRNKLREKVFHTRMIMSVARKRRSSVLPGPIIEKIFQYYIEN